MKVRRTRPSAAPTLGSALAGAGLEAPAGWRYRDIEVLGGGAAPPRLALGGVVAAAAAGFGARRWHLSLAHDASIAQAFVVAESQAGGPAGRLTPR